MLTHRCFLVIREDSGSHRHAWLQMLWDAWEFSRNLNVPPKKENHGLRGKRSVKKSLGADQEVTGREVTYQGQCSTLELFHSSVSKEGQELFICIIKTPLRREILATSLQHSVIHRNVHQESIIWFENKISFQLPAIKLIVMNFE